jgi:hypothetical protein
MRHFHDPGNWLPTNIQNRWYRDPLYKFLRARIPSHHVLKLHCKQQMKLPKILFEGRYQRMDFKVLVTVLDKRSSDIIALLKLHVVHDKACLGNSLAPVALRLETWTIFECFLIQALHSITFLIRVVESLQLH